MTFICNYITDRIALEQMTLRTAKIALAIARLFDRTESYHAAHIRDAIRDNYDLDTDALRAL